MLSQSFVIPTIYDQTNIHVKTMTHIDFELARHMPWTLSIETPDDLSTSLESFLARVRDVEHRSRHDPRLASVFRDTRKLTGYRFIAEACESEDVGTQTVEAAEAALAHDETDKLTHQQREGYNFGNAISHAIDRVTGLDEGVIADVHRRVGEAVIEEGPEGGGPTLGRYRTWWAMPDDGQTIYAFPESIAGRMRDLLADVCGWMPMNAIDACKRAAYFLANFLRIHPFRDGNGRVARICVTVLMKEFSVVPVSLWGGTADAITWTVCTRRASGSASPRTWRL
jgi:Fic family protein